MRAFIAIDLPEDVKKYIFSISEGIGNDNAQINWVKKGNIHLTLKFLGEVDNIDKIKEKLSKIKFDKFKLCIDKIGVFPSESYIRVVWIGFKDEGKVVELHDLISDEKFVAHATIGRVKFVKDKKKFVEKIKSVKVEERCFEVDKFKLIKSELTKEGSVYEVIEEFP